MVANPQRRWMSVEEYLELERKDPNTRYEPDEHVEFVSVQLEMSISLIYARSTVPVKETPEQD